MKKVLIFNIFTIASLLVFISQTQAGVLKVGEKAADFSLRSVTTSATTALADYAGEKLVVIGLFHICNPCRKQTVVLEKISNEFKGRDVAVVGINTAGDDVEAVREFVKSVSVEVHFPFLADPDGALDKSYNVRATPSVIIIDKKGIIVFKGFALPAGLLIEKINQML